MSEVWERADVLSIMAGVFDMKVRLDSIAENVEAIRELMDDDEEEEEASEDS